MTAFYLAAAVIVITGLAHVVLSATMEKVRDAANNNPGRLRGVTPQGVMPR
ncbi:hypothetical protein [Ralstonia sp. CP]|uniref:hypothetical protein n=1 Tax=Ralstonia sp. CP TaxID=3231757 RepID=UPI00345BF671